VIERFKHLIRFNRLMFLRQYAFISSVGRVSRIAATIPVEESVAEPRIYPIQLAGSWSSENKLKAG
jgi:hypothetical protein